MHYQSIADYHSKMSIAAQEPQLILRENELPRAMVIGSKEKKIIFKFIQEVGAYFQSPEMIPFAVEIYCGMMKVLQQKTDKLISDIWKSLSSLAAIRLGMKFSSPMDTLELFIEKYIKILPREDVKWMAKLEFDYCQTNKFDVPTPIKLMTDLIHENRHVFLQYGTESDFEKFQNISMQVLAAIVTSEDYWRLQHSDVAVCVILAATILDERFSNCRTQLLHSFQEISTTLVKKFKPLYFANYAKN